MLTGLREVPWSRLQHAYGDASDIPRNLRALSSNDARKRKEAATYLLHALVHQGLDRGPATTAATPFLIRLLDDEKIRDRHRLVRLLAYFAVGAPNNQHYFAQGYDLHFDADGAVEYGWLRIADPKYGPNMVACFARVAEGIDVYLRLAKARSVKLRRSIPSLLAWLTPHEERIVPLLSRRLSQEPDPLARGSVALALSLVTRREEAALVAAFARARRADERLMTAMALLRRRATPEVVRYLLSALGRPLPYIDAPWRIFDRHDVMLALLLERAPRSRAQILTAGRAALKQLSGSAAEDVAGWLAEQN